MQIPIDIKEFLSRKARELIASGTPGRLIVYGLSRHMDNLVAETYRHVAQHANAPRGSREVAILAIGGYGRSELYPFSDIDIMILSSDGNGSSKELAQAVLYGLWDKGLDLSHSFRTVRECAEDAMKDITTRTSLLESRFIAGSRDLNEAFRRDAYQRILFKNRKGFVTDILREVEKRHRQFGESIFLLEPNVKEGKGGLRDIHAISWLLRVSERIHGVDDYGRILAAGDLSNYVKAYDFIVKLRAALHCVSGRKNEVLSFDLQEDVARHFRFRHTSRSYPPEIMMRIYYSRARMISYFLQQVTDRCSRHFFSFPGLFSFRRITGDFYLYRNEIVVRNRDVFSSPEKIIDAFYVFSTTRNRLSQQTKDLIRVNAARIRKRSPLSAAIKSLFFRILNGGRVFETLREMHDTAVLERVVPAFSRLRHLVVYEPSHRYTVDKHSLVAIRHLEELRSTEDEKTTHLRELLGSARQHLLVLAILLHDIGKGVSRAHSEEGYHLIKGILDRFGLGHDEVKTIEFLVKNHVVLAMLALSRDVDAPETIIQLADMVGDEETLNALYLITYADMKALNPGYLTDWKSYLLHDLYVKTRDHLRGAKREVRDFADPAMKEFLDDMPGRYLISSTREMIEHDYLLSRRIGTEGLTVSVRENGDGSAELTLVARDRQRLFTAVVRALGSRNLDIMRARLFTSHGGLVVDRILISNWKALWWEGLLEEIRRSLEEEISRGGSDDSSQEGDLFQGASEPAAPPIRFKRLIEIDNESFAESTMVEVLVPDRPGLLRQIAGVLSSLGIDILAAVINTDDSVAHDVFYVQKDARKLDEALTLALMASLHSARYARRAGLLPG